MQWGFNGVVMCLYCRSCIEGGITCFLLVVLVKGLEERL